MGVGTQCGLNRVGLVKVAQRCGRTVGVHILDFVRIDSRIAQRRHHGPARAVHVWRGHVTGIGTHAKAGKFSVNLGTAGLGVLVLLQHHHTCALSQNKAIAVTVPRP